MIELLGLDATRLGVLVTRREAPPTKLAEKFWATRFSTDRGPDQESIGDRRRDDSEWKEIFRSPHPAAWNLRAYLAGGAEFIGLVMDQSEAGMEIVGSTQEYSVEANWKLLCKNSFDGYHGIPTHATYLTISKVAPGSS